MCWHEGEQGTCYGSQCLDLHALGPEMGSQFTWMLAARLWWLGKSELAQKERHPLGSADAAFTLWNPGCNHLKLLCIWVKTICDFLKGLTIIRQTFRADTRCFPMCLKYCNREHGEEPGRLHRLIYTSSDLGICNRVNW